MYLILKIILDAGERKASKALTDFILIKLAEKGE